MTKKDNRRGATDTSTPAAQKADDKKGKFTVTLLTHAEKKEYEFFQRRIVVLQKSRKNHYGHDLDVIWSEADRDYIPHRLSGTTKKTAIVVDETKGWRSTKINLGEENWQSDLSQSNVFVKVQTALSILVDQNPTGVFTAMLKKFQSTTELVKQLYERSWSYAKSISQLRLFIFNLAKYGWAVGRTYPLKVTRKVRMITNYDDKNPENNTYEEKEVVEYNDVMRENLDPRNTWIDDMARPNNPMSVNDWAFRKVYDYDEATDLFGSYRLWAYTQPGGSTTEVIGNANNT